MIYDATMPCSVTLCFDSTRMASKVVGKTPPVNSHTAYRQNYASKKKETLSLLASLFLTDVLLLYCRVFVTGQDR